jgi:hypothetical protein
MPETRRPVNSLLSIVIVAAGAYALILLELTLFLVRSSCDLSGWIQYVSVANTPPQAALPSGRLRGSIISVQRGSGVKRDEDGR